MSKNAYLILENGIVFIGKYFGAVGSIAGEIVFTTGMTGYLETLTDKSYLGQIIIQTFPLVGNYGVIPSDFESSSISASAYIVKSWCEEPSNFRSEGNLESLLKSKNVVGIYDIDTRALTKIIREYGVMNGKITEKKPEDSDLEEIKEYRIINAVERVSIKTVKCFKVKDPKYKVALIDFGLKENIKRELLKRNCDVYIFPYNSNIQDILKTQPDGIMLSNGPGDPADNPLVIQNLRQIINCNIPIFGICLGHQLLALANGFKTQKLKYGHRGANHPVKDLQDKKVYITSQNHGYGVISDSVDNKICVESFKNVNDNTCEGLQYLDYPAFSVQFHPEACGGPKDTAFLFDRFVKLMEVHK